MALSSDDWLVYVWVLPGLRSNSDETLFWQVWASAVREAW